MVYKLETYQKKRFHNNFFGNPKVTNLEYILSLPKDNKIIITEAEFDRISTGFKNSIASIGSVLSSDAIELLKGYELIFCLDADEEGYRRALQMAKKGYKVLVHETEMNNFKDVNKLLELGQSKKDIASYILKNIKNPRTAVIELMRKGIR